MAQLFQPLRSSHLQQDHGSTYALLPCRDACQRGVAEVHVLPANFRIDKPVARWWRHLKHGLTPLPRVELHDDLLGLERLLLHVAAGRPDANVNVLKFARCNHSPCALGWRGWP